MEKRKGGGRMMDPTKFWGKSTPPAFVTCLPNMTRQSIQNIERDFLCEICKD